MRRTVNIKVRQLLRIVARIAAVPFFLAGAGNFVLGLFSIPGDPAVIESFAYAFNFIWSVLIAIPGLFLWALGASSPPKENLPTR